MALSNSQKDMLNRAILSKIDELNSQIALAKESSQTVELDQTLAGRVSRIDAIQQQKMASAGLERTQKQLALLERALARIDEEYFGVCEYCGEDIPLARLKVKPESLSCVSCLEEQE